jgi:hypothetical protein
MAKKNISKASRKVCGRERPRGRCIHHYFANNKKDTLRFDKRRNLYVPGRKGLNFNSWA